ncbi:MAG: amidohydrolase family protein [Sphingomonadales bacterium]|nr:amidohydrolase family protein [Sphingomonadales bacterium]
MKSLTALAAALLAATTAPAEATPGDTVYVRAGHLLDVEAGTTLPARVLRVVDGRVAAITPDAPGAIPAAATVIDWSAFTVLPGLIDMHVHLADVDQTNNPAEPLLHSAMEVAYLGARNARTTLMAGFTSVHDVGCYRAFADVELRNAINRGDVIGPRMAAVGAYITVPGGGGEVTGLSPDVRLPDDMRVGVAASPADVTQRVNYLFQHGADSIKLLATGAVFAIGSEAGQQELTEDEMRAAVDAANVRHSWVTAHAHGAAGIKAAIRAGVRGIEHASLIDDEGIALARAHGTYLDMDIFNGDWTDEIGKRDHYPEDYMRKNTETTLAQREGFRKAVKAGVKLTFGTDAGIYPHGLNARQFRYMVQWGMTPLQAIRAATLTSAEMLGWQADVGSLTPGHYADMIAVGSDPLADITTLEHVAHVIKGGVVVK